MKKLVLGAHFFFLCIHVVVREIVCCSEKIPFSFPTRKWQGSSTNTILDLVDIVFSHIATILKREEHVQDQANLSINSII